MAWVLFLLRLSWGPRCLRNLVHQLFWLGVALCCFFPRTAFSEDPEVIEQCLLSEKKGLCLVSRSHEYFYKWCNAESVERIHLTQYGANHEGATPWNRIGNYAEQESNGHIQFFMNGRKCPSGDDTFHAEVSFTCCSLGRNREEILSVDEIRPCLWLLEICTSCHCDKTTEPSFLSGGGVLGGLDEEPSWSVKAEKRMVDKNDTDASFAQEMKEADLFESFNDAEEDSSPKTAHGEADARESLPHSAVVAHTRTHFEEHDRQASAQTSSSAAPTGAHGTAADDLGAAEHPERPLRDLLDLLDRGALKERTKRMFYHGYRNYMTKAFPMDELAPISCGGSVQKQTAGTMLTLIDTLDSLVVFGDYPEFVRSVRLVSEMASFNIDQNVSVFETNIRILGGLLSGHILSLDRRKLGVAEAFVEEPPHLPYDGKLLDLAVDLGDRLLPAFVTKTGISYGTVNLISGVPPQETSISSLAGAGSLYLEMGLLSSLTGDPKYAAASRRGMKELFSRRNSKTDLFGAHIDTKTGSWTEPHAGIGSNADSYFEYLFKSYVLFDDVDMLYMFRESYDAIQKHLHVGPWYMDASMTSGNQVRREYNNLQAFWPGLQSMFGDVIDGVESLNAIHTLWQKFGFTPEHYNWDKHTLVGSTGRREYLLRPEMIESIYHTHEYFYSHGDKTVADSWVEAGRLVLESLESTKVSCGHAAVRNVETKELQDNMPSFFLSETLKYLYLLFDETNPFRTSSPQGLPFVFSTEAHIFDVEAGQKGFGPFGSNFRQEIMPQPHISNVLFQAALTCQSQPWWERASLNFARPGSMEVEDTTAFSTSAALSRKSRKKSRKKLDMTTMASDDGMQLSIPGIGSFRIEALEGGFVVSCLTDHLFVEIANLGSEPVQVLEGFEQSKTKDLVNKDRPFSTWFHFKDGTTRQCFVAVEGEHFPCSPSGFGEFATVPFQVSGQLVLPPGDPEGCFDYADDAEVVRGHYVLIKRGGCMFEEKVLKAQAAGAAGVLIALVSPGTRLFIMAGVQEINDRVADSSEDQSEGAVARAHKIKEMEGLLTERIREGLPTSLANMILIMIRHLNDPRIPAKLKTKLLKTGLKILKMDQMDPSVPADPLLETELRELARETSEVKKKPKSQTTIPVVQVSFDTAKVLLSKVAPKLHEDSSSGNDAGRTTGLAIQLGNDQPGMIPEKFRQAYNPVLRGNATYMDVLTRGEWGVNLQLKSNEWQLGITKRVHPNADTN